MSEMTPDPSGNPEYPPPPAAVNPYGNQYDAPQPQYGQPQYGQPQYGQPQYGQPQYGQPQYGQPQYGQPQYGQPQYGQPPASGAPSGQYPYAPAFNAYGQPSAQGARPGQALASSVLAYILAGILILTGVLLLFGASSVNSIGNSFNSDTSSVAAEFAFDGFVDICAAALLIAGGVTLTSGRRRGRTFIVIATAITLLDCVYWIARSSGDGGVLVFMLLYGGLAATALGLALSAKVKVWLGAMPGAAPPTYLG